MDTELRQFALMVLREELNLEVGDDFACETPFGADGVGLSSLTLLELCARFEEEYDVVIINTLEHRLPRSVGELFDYVHAARTS